MENEQVANQEASEHEDEKTKQAKQKENVFPTLGIVLTAIAFLFLILIVNWPVSIKVGIVVVGSGFPLLWAAFYSRAHLLYGRKKEPVALNLWLLGTLIAVFGEEALLFSLHLPLWFSLLCSFEAISFIIVITCLLQIHWQQVFRQRRPLEERDPEIMLIDEKDAREERSVLKWLLLLAGCPLIAAGIPVALFYLKMSLGWAAIFIGSLSIMLIVWGEYNLRAHLLYGYQEKPGIGWAIFLGILTIYFYVNIYLSSVVDLRFFNSLIGLFNALALIAQAQLSRRWKTKGENQRQAIHPGTDLQGMIEQQKNIPE